jgi:hypothetical protein
MTVAPRQLAAFVSLAMASLCVNAQAEDGDKMFSLSGFGTAGVVHSSNNKGDFVTDSYEKTGAGYSDATSVGVDSKFAMQLDARLTDSLSGVVQLLMRQHADGTYKPKVEWANLKYAITRDLSVRVGRIALPVFMASDTRLVGFANPWVRTPVETYGGFPVSNSDGVDASYRHNFGGVSSTTQVAYGKTKVDVVNASGSISKDLHATITSLGDTVEVGALTAKLGWTRSDIELQAAPTVLLKFQSKIVNLGAVYDVGTWFVQGEVTRTSLGTVKRATRNAYVTGGYRIGQFTPYVGYSMITPDDEQVKLQLIKQHTSTLGLRWDFRKNMDLKLQAERIGLADGSTGMFTNIKPGLAGTSGTVLSAAVDFVF